jgi:antitoxin VapB
MALNIEDAEVETLAGEVAALAHETKTEAIRQALLQRRVRLQARADSKYPGRKNLQEYLEKEVWPLMPASEMGRTLTREEEDEILGFGPEGY